MKRFVLLVILCCLCARAQIVPIDNEPMATARVKINNNFAYLDTNTMQGHPPSGTTLPTNCVVGQMFIKTNAVPGSNLYVATSTSSPCLSWIIIGGGGGGGGGAPAPHATSHSATGSDPVGIDAAQTTSGIFSIGRLPLGTTGSTVAAGNDSRFSDARPPTGHASSHGVGGSDPLTPAAIGAEATVSKGVANGYAGLDSGAKVPATQLPFPAASTKGGILTTACGAGTAVDSYQTDGTPHCVSVSGGGGAPAAHASTHASGGSDPVSPASIGAVALTGANAPLGYAAIDGAGKMSAAVIPFPGSAGAFKGGILDTKCTGGQVADGYQTDGTPHCVAGGSGGVPYTGATADLDMGTHAIHAGSITIGSGTASSNIALPELTANGSDAQRIYGADNQASTNCIVWPTGASTSGQVAADSGATATMSDSNVCRVFTWQTPSGGGGGSSVLNHQEALSAVGCSTSEQTLFTYTIPASTLAAGKMLRVFMAASSSGIDQNVDTALYLGSTSTPITSDIGMEFTGANPVLFEGTVLVADSTHQHISWGGRYTGSITANKLFVASPTETLSGSVVLKAVIKCLNTTGSILPQAWIVQEIQ